MRSARGRRIAYVAQIAAEAACRYQAIAKEVLSILHRFVWWYELLVWLLFVRRANQATIFLHNDQRDAVHDLVAKNQKKA